MLRVGINGFGRIGRAIFRSNLKNKYFDVVAINEINQNKDNISIDNSILIYDYVNKSSRNIYLPNSISEIHEVLAI